MALDYQTFIAESAEQLQELKKSTLGKYISAATSEKDYHDKKAAEHVEAARKYSHTDKHSEADEEEQAMRHDVKADKRGRGIAKAISKLDK